MTSGIIVQQSLKDWCSNRSADHDLPNAEPKISMMSILTKRSGRWASPSAHPEPETPTQMPQNKFENPTLNPTVNMQ